MPSACLLAGVGPSSPQYSSSAAMRPSSTRKKEVTWKETVRPASNTRTTVMSSGPMASTRSISPSHAPGYSQLARMNSSAVKRSLVLGQSTWAPGAKNAAISPARWASAAAQ